MSATHSHPDIDVGVLARYWLGELDAEREAAIERHLFECATCTDALEALAVTAQGIRELVRRGAVLAVVSDAFVKRLCAQGVRLNEYRVPRDGSVNCTVAPDDEVAIARLQAPLGDVQRVDVLLDVTAGVPHQRLEDVPFDPAAGEIVVTPRIARLRALPASTALVRLVAVRAGRDEIIGEYRFHHTPWSELHHGE
ncbi:MAG TPA: zf-HC2 domain-containing protein [Casimicrobiaceae bacterium]|nr:zf-HC2 domain-containing protein [Casimicrobiaceae bacterium]